MESVLCMYEYRATHGRRRGLPPFFKRQTLPFHWLCLFCCALLASFRLPFLRPGYFGLEKEEDEKYRAGDESKKEEGGRPHCCEEIEPQGFKIQRRFLSLDEAPPSLECFNVYVEIVKKDFPALKIDEVSPFKYSISIVIFSLFLVGERRMYAFRLVSS